MSETILAIKKPSSNLVVHPILKQAQGHKVIGNK